MKKLSGPHVLSSLRTKNNIHSAKTVSYVREFNNMHPEKKGVKSKKAKALYKTLKR